MTLLADCVVQARKKGDAQHYAKALKRSLLAWPPRWLCPFHSNILSTVCIGTSRSDHFVFEVDNSGRRSAAGSG